MLALALTCWPFFTRIVYAEARRLRGEPPLPPDAWSFVRRFHNLVAGSEVSLRNKFRPENR